jgi:hypothetical protein
MHKRPLPGDVPQNPALLALVSAAESVECSFMHHKPLCLLALSY